MEAIVEFYLNELRNNQELPRDDREKYLEVINTYTQALLKRMLD
jgi:hypothetical protein